MRQGFFPAVQAIQNQAQIVMRPCRARVSAQRFQELQPGRIELVVFGQHAPQADAGRF
jgi:hypothetical protein